MVRKIFLLVGLAFVALVTSAARAQDIVADQLYGSGVHRYFAGDLRAAHGDFTAAIQAGTDDPRPYYFRALTYLRMGRAGEARADLQKGADLEAADINGSYQVSKALERVQGGLRLQLERHRRQARAIALQRQEQQRRDRYAAARRFEAERVQRASAMEEEPRGRAAAPDVTGPFDEATAPAPLPTPTSPFGAPPAAPAEKPAEAETSPFGVPAAEEKAPAEPPAIEQTSPFGAPITPIAPTEKPAATPAEEPAAAETSPFGPAATPPGAAADTDASPFGAPIPPAPQPRGATEPATDSPFGAPPPDDSNNSAAPANPVGAQTPPSPEPASGGRGNASKPSATGGFLSALRRAAGNVAGGVTGSAAKALPIGRSAPRMALPAKTSPPGGAPFGAPQAAGGAPRQPMEDQDIDPFKDPGPADTPPANSAADPDNPFGPPGGEINAAPAAPGNPFQDDPVQSGAPPADERR